MSSGLYPTNKKNFCKSFPCLRYPTGNKKRFPKKTQKGGQENEKHSPHNRISPGGRPHNRGSTRKSSTVLSVPSPSSSGVRSVPNGSPPAASVLAPATASAPTASIRCWPLFPWPLPWSLWRSVGSTWSLGRSLVNVECMPIQNICRLSTKLHTPTINLIPIIPHSHQTSSPPPPSPPRRRGWDCFLALLYRMGA